MKKILQRKFKIKTKDIEPVTLIIPYMLTIVWMASFIGLFIINDLAVKIFLGMISVTGFVLFITRGKNLKHLKISATGIEINFSEKSKINMKNKVELEKYKG